MAKLRSFLAYTLAIIMVFLVLATFVGMNRWSQLLVGRTEIKISPWITGGEVMRRITREDYQLVVHEPVFRGLLGDKERGFIQIDWTPLGSLPRTLSDSIDWDADGHDDFQVRLDTGKGEAVLVQREPHVLGIRQVLKLSNAWMVRVDLERK